MIADGLHRLTSTVHDLEDSIRQPGLAQHLGDPPRGEWHELRRLENESVSGRNRRGKHPKRNHRGKIEWRDAGDDPERLAKRIDVDARAGPFRIFALQQVRDPADEFDNLEAALDIALGVHDHLAVFG